MENLSRLRLGDSSVLERFARGGEHLYAAGGKDGLNAKDVRRVADDQDAMEVILARDGEYASDGLFCRAAVGFGNDGAGGNAVGAQEVFADFALGETISGSAAAECDENGREAALIEAERVFKTGAKDARRATVVFGSAEDADDVSLRCLIGVRGAEDLPIDPAKPANQREDADKSDEDEQRAKGCLQPAVAMGSRRSSHRAGP